MLETDNKIVILKIQDKLEVIHFLVQQTFPLVLLPNRRRNGKYIPLDLEMRLYLPNIELKHVQISYQHDSDTVNFRGT